MTEYEQCLSYLSQELMEVKRSLAESKIRLHKLLIREQELNKVIQRLNMIQKSFQKCVKR